MHHTHTRCFVLTIVAACGRGSGGPTRAAAEPPPATVATVVIDAAVPDAAPPPPRLACDAGTAVLAAPAPEPTWWCARPDGTRHGPFLTLFPDATAAVTGTYRDGVLDGVWTRRDPNGTVVEEGRYTAGKKDGVWKQTSSAGVPLGEYTMTGGSGVEITWFESGPRYRERAFKDGALHGSSRVYAADGTIVIAARYADGKLDGAHAFGTRGSLRIEETFAQGVRRGKRAIWVSGLLVAEENYDKRGRLDGPYTLWRKPRVPRVRGAYKAGKREGLWVWTDRRNRKEKEATYVDGKREGAWTEWEGAAVELSGTYLDDKADGDFLINDWRGRELGRYTMTQGSGTVLTFYANKKPSSKLVMVAGLAHGAYQELTPSGRVVVDGAYRNDRKHGTWTFSTPSGVRTLVQTWKHGKLDGKLEKYVDGKLATSITYDEGKVTGPYAEYRDGKPAIAGQYVDDVKDGAWTTYTSEGTVRATATYKRGVLDGPWRQLVDGAVVEGEMAAGRRVGIWTRTERGGAVSKTSYATP